MSNARARAEERPAQGGSAGSAAAGGAGTRPGGRAARVVDAIMWATISELARTGFETLRVDDVAVAAKVNKTTIYRRWPTKMDLVAAALRASNRDLSFMPNTGSLREDLLALLGSHAQKYRSIEMRGLSRVFLGDITSPELARLVASLRAEYKERWYEVVRRGIERGELPAGTRVDLVADLISSVSSIRLLRNDDPLDLQAREVMVDLVLAGANATGADQREAKAKPIHLAARVAKKPAGRPKGAAVARARSSRGAGSH